MKIPKTMSLKLKNNNTLTIDLKNQVFDKTRGVFEVTFEISKVLIDSKLDKNIISFETEDK